MPVSTIREQKTEIYQLTDITINLQNIHISHCGNSYSIWQEINAVPRKYACNA